VHLLVASDLEWDPLEMEDGEEILVHTFHWIRRWKLRGKIIDAILKLLWHYGCILEVLGCDEKHQYWLFVTQCLRLVSFDCGLQS